MKAAQNIVYTSVSDGLCNATYATVKDIRKAFALEKSHTKPRKSLLQGLEREIRRRK